MSTLPKETAWQITGAFVMRAVESSEDETVALEALASIAEALRLDEQGVKLRGLLDAMRKVNSGRMQLRGYFDGQMELKLEGLS